MGDPEKEMKQIKRYQKRRIEEWIIDQSATKEEAIKQIELDIQAEELKKYLSTYTQTNAEVIASTHENYISPYANSDNSTEMFIGNIFLKMKERNWLRVKKSKELALLYWVDSSLKW
jgi:NAD+--asparagine ADP-ribosyltransferase